MSDLNDYQIIQVGDLPVAETLEGLNILGFDSTNNLAVRALMDLLKGLDGKPVELQKTATHLQWRVQGGTWADLLALDEVKGAPGDPNTLTIGTVQTGATSSATITGTAPSQTLNLTLQKGDTGSNIELQKTATHVQWRVVGGTWANLIPLSDLKGAQGDNISLQKTATHIQWSLGAGAWTNLVALTELKGDTGANLELQKSATHVQWRVQGTTTWNNLILIDDLKVKGDTGANIELQKSTTHVQWRVQGTTTWNNLIALSELKGEKGDTPVKGVDYFDGKNAVMTIGTITTVASNAQANATVESDGVDAEGKPKFKLNLWLPKGVDGEGAGDMLKSVYDQTGKNTDVFGYVDNKVKTDVPVDAKFTDTTYNNATTSVSGLMSNTDKSKLDGVEAGANKYVHPAGTNPHGTTKSDVGLGNVDNVKQIPFSEKGANNGVAELDSTGKVLSSQLPSYVDDVLEYATSTNFPTTGETGKIYIAINTNLTYRWTGTSYTEISPSIALGETSATAYRGDRGKTAYDHSQTAHAPSNAQKNSDITKAEIEAKLTGAITTHSHTVTKANVGLGNVDNIQQASKTEFDTHNSDSTRHITSSERTAWNAKGSSNLALGETSATAYRGDRGKTAYDHSQTAHAPSTAQKNSDITKAEIEAKLTGAVTTHSHTVTKANVGLGNVDNTSDANKPVSTAQQTALNAKMDSNKFQVVESLPASPVSGTFYFVKE